MLCPKGHPVDTLDLVLDTSSDAASPVNRYLCRTCDTAYLMSELRPTMAELDGYDHLPDGGVVAARVKKGRIQQLVRELLLAIGEDPDREGLADTPRRVANFWNEFINYKDENTNTTFESFQADQMVVVSGIPTWSLCEHHLLPFSATVSVGYVPKPPDKNGEILGLSKVARVVHLCAHKLSTQERLVDDVHNMLEGLLKDPLGIAVVASGVHTCMTMRGVRTPGVMTTSKVSGIFKRQDEVRQEFFSLIKHGDTFGRW
jgi:GTP cyclohydrolase I